MKFGSWPNYPHGRSRGQNIKFGERKRDCFKALNLFLGHSPFCERSEGCEPLLGRSPGGSCTLGSSLLLFSRLTPGYHKSAIASSFDFSRQISV